MVDMDDRPTMRRDFEHEVQARFGVLPHFFQSAPDSPELVEQLWAYAKAAYLDNPLPSLFKERLFVYLSRFCSIRYCIVRHAGFLLGHGRPSGDASAPPESVQQVMRLLRRPPPSSDEMQRVLSTLSAMPGPLRTWPAPETREEELILLAATALFLEPSRSEAVKSALRKAVGAGAFDQLVGLLCFIRSAHYWTLLHPELTFEEDVEGLLRDHRLLADLLLHDPEAGRSDLGRRLFDELATLREAIFFRDAAKEFESSKQRLEELHQRKDSFLAVVSHELRNPISAIRTATEVLGMLEIEDPRVAELHGILSRQTAAVARIVDDLLDMSRVSLDKLSLRQEAIDLCEVIENSVGDRGAALVAPGIALQLDLPESPVVVRGDRVRLEQVLENLLSNALRHTPSPGEVSVSLCVEENAAIVEVSDTGVGFDAELAQTLFVPFFQASVATRKHGGLGLGLPIARRIAELHGGTLTGASPGINRGAKFVWSIPLETPTTSDPAHPTDGPDRPGRPQRILVVEDDRDAAQALLELLRLAGHEARLAHDGASGLEELDRWQPDVVLCDLSLTPSMSGFDFARACLQDPRLASTRLIAISGYCTARDAEEARAVGFERLLGKPLDLEKIRSALTDVSPVRS